MATSLSHSGWECALLPRHPYRLCRPPGCGSELDPDVAAALQIDGHQGFYLADHRDDAEFFALRRWSGTVVVYELSHHAVDRLLAAGATQGPIPGGWPPYFQGQELFLPAALFPLFNELLKGGEINVV